MNQVPNLLNDDGTASIATAMMLSHHAFRRDLRRFARALETMASGEASRAEAVREEWQYFRQALHGHHEMEDSAIFPGIVAQAETVRSTVDRLGADHRVIDPLLEQGDRAFDALPAFDEALAVVRELDRLLWPHLALEEAELVPFLRASKDFPPPPNDEVAEMYAQGFSWSMDGIAPDVLDRVCEMLPEILRAKLPAARSAFEARCVRAWGAVGKGAARTPVPDEGVTRLQDEVGRLQDEVGRLQDEVGRLQDAVGRLQDRGRALPAHAGDLARGHSTLDTPLWNGASASPPAQGSCRRGRPFDPLRMRPPRSGFVRALFRVRTKKTPRRRYPWGFSPGSQLRGLDLTALYGTRTSGCSFCCSFRPMQRIARLAGRAREGEREANKETDLVGPLHRRRAP